MLFPLLDRRRRTNLTRSPIWNLDSKRWLSAIPAALPLWDEGGSPARLGPIEGRRLVASRDLSALAALPAADRPDLDLRELCDVAGTALFRIGPAPSQAAQPLHLIGSDYSLRSEKLTESSKPRTSRFPSQSLQPLPNDRQKIPPHSLTRAYDLSWDKRSDCIERSGAAVGIEAADCACCIDSHGGNEQHGCEARYLTLDDCTYGVWGDLRDRFRTEVRTPARCVAWLRRRVEGTQGRWR